MLTSIALGLLGGLTLTVAGQPPGTRPSRTTAHTATRQQDQVGPRTREGLAMTSDLKQRWVEALRSGKYKQTTGMLRRGDCFCAIGVLCDIRDPTLWEEFPGGGMESSWSYAPGHAMSDLFNSDFFSSSQHRLVVRFNDAEEMTFPDIAYWIEANVATED